MLDYQQVPFVAAEILAENFADDREVCSRLLAATSDILLLLGDKRKRNRHLQTECDSAEKDTLRRHSVVWRRLYAT
jgi:hypothetical protein